MKHHLNNFSRVLAALAVVCCAAVASSAADRDLARVISAKAGGVNYVAGDVSFKRAGATGWERLTTSDDLKSGDSVRTGADSRAEILLNPGSYLRLGRDTEFVFSETALDRLRLQLKTGSAVVEVTGFSDIDVLLTVDTPETRVELLRSGLYRFNAGRSGATEVFVHSGRAFVRGTVIKGGQFARVGAGAGEVVAVKFDRKLQRDALDLWSRDRAQELARINERLQRRSVNTLLAHTSFTDLFYGAGRYGHLGVWLWSPLNSCYTFLPFAFGWPSPYGFSYELGYYGYYSAGFCTPCLHRRLRQRWDYGIINNNPDLGWTGGSSAPSAPKSSQPSVWSAPASPSAPGGSRTTTVDVPRGGGISGKGDKP
jgi:hypothetical protein